MKIKDLSDRFIEKVARYYISDEYITLAKTGKKFGFSANSISNILLRGVEENIIDDITVKKIIEKIVYVKDIGVFQRKLRWQEALYMRRKNQEAERNQIIKAEIDFIDNQIESFDDYFFEEESSPTKEYLIQRRNNLIAQLS